MRFFKTLYPLSALVLYSCGSLASSNPAFITTDEKSKAFRMVAFDQNLGEVKDLSPAIADNKTVLLPDNDFIALRMVKSSPHAFALPTLVLERYNEIIKPVWSTPVNITNSVKLFYNQNSNSIYIINSGYGRFISKEYDANSGKSLNEKELFKVNDWSEDHVTQVKFSPDSSKILIATFIKDQSRMLVHLFDNKLTLINSATVTNLLNKDNEDIQREIILSNTGQVYVAHSFENMLEVSGYNLAGAQSPLTMSFDMRTLPSGGSDNEIQSLFAGEVNSSSFPLTVQYGDGSDVEGLAILRCDVQSGAINIEVDKAGKSIEDDGLDDYHINSSFFFSTGEKIVILEKKYERDFDHRVTKNPVYIGTAPVYETLVIVKFNAKGDLVWKKSIERDKEPLPFSTMVNVYRTNETSAMARIYDNILYLAYRDRHRGNDYGFSLYKIKTDNGELSKTILPIAMPNSGYGVFFMRNMTQWTPDSKMILFTKEAIGTESNAGKIIKLDLNQL